jgi:hypothetical protein
MNSLLDLGTFEMNFYGKTAHNGAVTGAGCKAWSHRVGSEIGPTISLGYIGYSKTTGITS